METIIYKQEVSQEELSSIIKKEKELRFLHIGKSVELANDNQQMHIIELVSCNKSDYQKLITPLAYFIGEENQFTLEEEEMLLEHFNKELYNSLRDK